MRPNRSRSLLLAAFLLLGGSAVRAEDALPPGALVRLGTQHFRQPYVKSQAVYVAVAPGGKVLATRSDARVVRLWDPTGRLLHQLEEPDGVTAFAFAPDGKRLATGCGRSLRIWDTATGQSLHQWQGHKHTVSAVAFTPDGRSLLSGGADRRVILWDPAAGKEIISFGDADRQDIIVAVAVSPDGKSVAAAGRRSTVYLWDAATAQERHHFDSEDGRLSAIAFAPDSKSLAVAGKMTTRLWDTDSGKEVRPFGSPVAGEIASYNNDETLSFSPDGSQLATGGKSIRLWETATGKEIRGFGETRRRVSSVAFLGDKELATGGGDQVLHRWETATGKEVRIVSGHRDAVRCAAFSPDGKWIVTGGADRAVFLWDAATGKVIRELTGHDSGLTAVAFSASGSLLASADAGGCVRVWDSATGKERFVFNKHTGWVSVLAFSPDGKALATGGHDGKLMLFDITREGFEREVHQFPKHADGTTAVAFSVDGKFLASGAGNGQVRLWKMDLGQEVGAPEASEEDDPLFRLVIEGNPRAAPPPSPVLLLHFSPSGKQLTSWLDSGAIVIWDAATRKQLRQFDGPAAGGTSAAFSGDGRTLAARDKNNQVTLREAATGQERLLLQGHPDRDFVWALAFAPDSRRLVSVGDDTTAVVWDVTGRMQNGQLAPVRLTAKDLDVIWGDLAHEKGERAYRGIWALTAGASDALPYLQEKLKPEAVDPKHVEKLIADLDSNVFIVRQKAIAELEELSELAEDAMKKALAAKPPLEVSQRLEKLLTKVDKERNALNPHRLRILRASEALEQIGGDEAKKILEGLAEAPPELRLTEEVKREVRASLDRLNRRPAKP